MSCYRQGGCGPYEMLSCNECPASKPEYKERYQNNDLYVVSINGENKDNYMAIGSTEQEAKENVLLAFFKEENHTEKELEKDHGCYLTMVKFDKNTKAIVF